MPKPEWELTDQERRAIEVGQAFSPRPSHLNLLQNPKVLSSRLTTPSIRFPISQASLVDMALGLERQQTHDDMLLMAVRNRENAGQRTDKLIELAHVGIAKTPKVVDPRGRK